jgi:hypothetical protein
MKRFKLGSMVVAVVLTVTAISCSPVRYSDGYDEGVGVYSSSPAYYGVDPYIGYYTPSPYYSVPYYGGTYYGRTVRPNREYRERRDYPRQYNNRQDNRAQYNRQQNNRVYQNNNQPVQHYKGNPLLYLQQQKRNNH